MLKHLANIGKRIDREVLREYSKIAKRWEDKGRNIKTLTIISNLGGIGFDIYIAYIAPTIAGNANIILGYLLGMDFGRNSLEKIDQPITDTIVCPNIYKEITNLSRLPCFALGAGYSLDGLFGLYNYFVNNDNSMLNGSMPSLLQGLSYLGFSSSVYLKARDPKLLDKKSLWDQVYDGVADKVKSLMPSPVPQPVSIRTSYLEDRVE